MVDEIVGQFSTYSEHLKGKRGIESINMLSFQFFQNGAMGFYSNTKSS